jgi:acyl-CoA synthetase (AMP-forming)/AMP-acid ligase II
MGIRSILARPFASWVVSKQKNWMRFPGQAQESVFQNLMSKAADTRFGKDHGLKEVKTHADFIRRVPIRDYEALKDYVALVKEGNPDILWPGKPVYFAKTSGTTSGTKYIPITKESIPNHIQGARDALLNYVYHTGKAGFLDKKLIFLSGSPVLETMGGIHTGRLSGIVNHHVPGYLRTNQLPGYETNCIEDWEEKLEKIIDETLGQPMGLISGIPPWVQMYFDRIQARTGKLIKDVFPDFSVFVYGGVNFEPYRKKLYDSIGRKVPGIELFPASEGFFAFQDLPESEGLLLLLQAGIFYEFVPVEEYFSENPTRLSIEEVELGKNYALIINSNAGLWGYSIGDTVKFVSKRPYRLLVTGRIKHFISAFGEHVIGEEVEKALQRTLEYHPEVSVSEFTVAPQVSPEEGLPHHEWLIEFANRPANMPAFERRLDESLCKLNSYYNDLIQGKILSTLVVNPLPAGRFQAYMKSKGKLGGQNKVPRLSNDRVLAEGLANLQC